MVDNLWRYSQKRANKRGKKNLRRIGIALIPTTTFRSQYPTDDGLVHICPKEKGDHHKLTFDDHPLRAKKYFNEFERVLKVFEEEKPERDFQRIIEERLGEVITDEEMMYFNVMDITTTTASYMARKHKKICQRCKNKPVKDNYEDQTFKKIYQKAKEFLSQYE